MCWFRKNFNVETIIKKKTEFCKIFKAKIHFGALGGAADDTCSFVCVRVYFICDAIEPIALTFCIETRRNSPLDRMWRKLGLTGACVDFFFVAKSHGF